MAPHSSTLAWKIPWTEKPGRLQTMGSLRVWNDWVTSLFTFHFQALEKEMATHSSVLAWRIPGTGEPGGLPSMGSQSWTRLKWLSSSSSVLYYLQWTCYNDFPSISKLFSDGLGCLIRKGQCLKVVNVQCLFFFFFNIYLAVLSLSCRMQNLPECLDSVVVVHRLSCPVTCGILVPRPRIEPTSPALQGRW